MGNKKHYDQAARNQATIRVSLRVLVSGYIIYLAVLVLKGTINGTSAVPDWIAILAAGVFIAAAVAFIVYSILTYTKAIKAAELHEPPGDTDGTAEIEDGQSDGTDEP